MGAGPNHIIVLCLFPPKPSVFPTGGCSARMRCVKVRHCNGFGGHCRYLAVRSGTLPRSVQVRVSLLMSLYNDLPYMNTTWMTQTTHLRINAAHDY